MRIAVVYNLSNEGVINVFGRQNKEQYQPKEIEAVVEALRGNKHIVETFEGDKYLIEKLEAFMPRALKRETPGLVFNLAYGIQGESRYTHMPSLLEMLGIPYVGSGPLAHSVALDKAMTKMVLSQAGLPTPAFQVMSTPDEPLDSNLRFPLIVKPKDEAVSFGIKVVHDEDQLRDAVTSNLDEFRQATLVEEFLDGKEVNVGLLGNGQQMETLPIVEIDFGDAKERLQTFETKKGHDFNHQCPADLPEELAEEVRDLTRRTFETIGCRDFARVDFRMDDQDRPYILELNSMAAIHGAGSFTIAAGKVGYDYQSMINRMVEVAAIRYFGAQDEASTSRTKKVVKEEKAKVRATDFLRAASAKMEQRLEELVGFRSYVRNKEITDQMCRAYQRGLESMGFSCQSHPQTEIGDVLLFSNDPGQRYHADVLLLCHVDLFALSHDKHRKYHREGSRLYGSGVAESKAGMVVVEYALRALRHLRLLSQLRVKVLLSTDASLGNRYSESIIQQQSLLSRRVLSFKPGGAGGAVVTRRNGTGYFSTMVDGEEKHFTGDDLVGGVSAIEELAHKVRMWNKLSDPKNDTFVYVNSLRAEEHAGYLPDHAHASLFISFPHAEVGDRLVTDIEKIARKSYCKGSRCALTTEIMRAPFSETTQVEALYDEVAAVAEDIGRPLDKIGRFTASDINVVPLGVPALDGLGPVGHNTRTPDEYVEAPTMVERAALLALYLRDIAVKNKGSRQS